MDVFALLKREPFLAVSILFCQRMAVSPAQFRALYRRSFRRYFDGIRS
ncbi:MAG TPA: hypothetical protein VGT99_08235 [Gammaproteobacteria bacterium]|nr:hypothetical protein [Gammaproteobacteria bacterium]